MNAKVELLEFLNTINKKVIAAKIQRNNYHYDSDTTPIIYDSDKDNFDEFLDKLNFEYNSGFGAQELNGIVIFEDNSWIERHEYDGLEWWEEKRPFTKEELFNLNLWD